jgi:hypothetical protein
LRVMVPVPIACSHSMLGANPTKALCRMVWIAVFWAACRCPKKRRFLYHRQQSRDLCCTSRPRVLCEIPFFSGGRPDRIRALFSSGPGSAP